MDPKQPNHLRNKAFLAKIRRGYMPCARNSDLPYNIIIPEQEEDKATPNIGSRMPEDRSRKH